jgi:hypothetical protein
MEGQLNICHTNCYQSPARFIQTVCALWNAPFPGDFKATERANPLVDAGCGATKNEYVTMTDRESELCRIATQSCICDGFYPRQTASSRAAAIVATFAIFRAMHAPCPNE